MCFFYRLSKKATELENRFGAKIKDKTQFKSKEKINAFEFGSNLVLANNNITEFQYFNWGLIPTWAQDESIKKYTLNARIETLSEKSSFRNYTSNRCIIPADGFYEWQWLDAKGKNKQAYLLTLPSSETFGIAGIWSPFSYNNRLIHTFTILTTPAQGIMCEIHNSKQRMPLIINSENEKDWLQNANIHDFQPNYQNLIAQKI